MTWKKYGTDRRATDDNITTSMHFACWITKATDTHSEYVINLLLFHSNNGYVNMLRHYIIQSGPKICIHSLLINIFGINLNEISISG